MKRDHHQWNVSVEKAAAIQRELAQKVITEDTFDTIRYVAGTDVGFEENNTISRAAIVVVSLPELSVVEYSIVRAPVTFPYITGFLSFRELPVLLEAWKKLKKKPDLVLCDGQGIAHPRRLGIASHLGVLLDIPSIGVAKTHLIGKYEEPPIEKGSWTPMIDRGEAIGAVLRSRSNVKPLFISPGHRISTETAVAYVLQCTTKYRLPETTRLSHKYASGL